MSPSPPWKSVKTPGEMPPARIQSSPSGRPAVNSTESSYVESGMLSIDVDPNQWLPNCGLIVTPGIPVLKTVVVVMSVIPRPSGLSCRTPAFSRH